jgi:hypothetical protein
MTPMGQTTSTDLKLNGFKWLESLRPKNKFDILAPNN